MDPQLAVKPHTRSLQSNSLHFYSFIYYKNYFVVNYPTHYVVSLRSFIEFVIFIFFVCLDMESVTLPVTF